MERIIWMYWEDLPGRRRPPYLDVCLETIHHHKGDAEVRLLDEESILRWLPDLAPEIWRRFPNPMYRSDYARTRLVHRHGGLWLDCDVIAVSSLDPIFDALETDELVGWGGDLEGRFYNNLFAGRPGGALLEEWIRQQDEVAERVGDQGTLSWGALGQDIIWPLARRSSYRDLPSRRIAPIPWYAWRQLLSRVASPAIVLAHRPITVMLWNSAMAPFVGDLSRNDVLGGRMLLSRLLRIGLGTSTADQEMDAWTKLHLASDLRFSTQGRRLELHARRVVERLRPRGGVLERSPA